MRREVGVAHLERDRFGRLLLAQPHVEVEAALGRATQFIVLPQQADAAGVQAGPGEVQVGRRRPAVVGQQREHQALGEQRGGAADRADHRQAHFLRVGNHRHALRGAGGRGEREDLVLFHQAARHRDAACRLVAVVVGDEIDLPAVQRIGLVGPLEAGVGRVGEDRIEGHRPGDGREGTDRHRLGGQVDSRRGSGLGLHEARQAGRSGKGTAGEEGPSAHGDVSCLRSRSGAEAAI